MTWMALLDTDRDGTSNAEESSNGTNPLEDDYPPVITPPESVHYYADHTFTEFTLEELIDITEVSVRDGRDGLNCCNLTALGFERGAKNITSGVHQISWRAIDEAGNVAELEQTINVHPLINFTSDQTIGEGGTG